MRRIIQIVLVFFALCLTTYSYTQVDLSLTLTGVGPLVYMQQYLQKIGYFQRFNSAIYFSTLIGLLLVIHIYVQHYWKKLQFSIKDVWILIFGISTILLFSYPAFSYDIYNYMFTAKTVLVYHDNPYVVLPLQYAPIDTWLSFMHWTHLPSAYAPLWIAISLISYIAGLGNLLGILFATKALAVLSYLGIVYFYKKILDVSNTINTTQKVLLLAINPVMIIELLVSGHNDGLMIAIALAAIYLMMTQKKLFGWMLLALSIAIKTMTLFAIPGYLYLALIDKDHGAREKWILLISMCFGLVLVLSKRDMLGWYWVWIIPFVGIVANEYLKIISDGISFGLIFQYVPFLYYGVWDPPVSVLKSYIMILCIGISVLYCIYILYRDKFISAVCKNTT